MKTAFIKDNTRYVFHFSDDGNDNFITLVINSLNLDWEKVVTIPVRNADGYAVKINKKSCSADGGAYGLFKFIRRCIDNDFMMVYVNRIVENFG